MIPSQLISFAIGPVVQSTGKKHLRAGELTEIHNVRSIIDNEIRKRPGFDRQSPTAASGSFTSDAESLTFDGIGLISRDGDDRAWLENTDASTRSTMGRQERALPEAFNAPLVTSPIAPVSVLAGGYLWVFVKQTNAYTWHVQDPDTGAMIKAPATATATGVVMLSVAADATYVWLIFAGASSATSHRYTIASPTTAVTTTTYIASFDAGNGLLVGIDAQAFTNNTIAVTISFANGATGFGKVNISYLDPATGAADASPAAVQQSFAYLSVNNGVAWPPRILEGQTGAANWYYAWWVDNGGNIELTLTEVNFTTLAVVSAVALATVVKDATASRPAFGWCCGYLADNGDRVVYSTQDQYTAAADNNPRPYLLKRHVRAGATTTTTLRRYSYPLSDPFKIGTSWYLATGFDDGKANDLQRSYWIVDSDGNIVTQFDSPGSGVGAGQQDAATASPSDAFVTGSSASGNAAYIVALTDLGGGSTTDFAPTTFRFDFDADWGPPVQWSRGKIAVPGGIPTRVGSGDVARELTPLLFPMPVAFTAGGGAALGGATTVQVIFRLYDADGTLYRSSPCAAQTQTFNTTGRAVIVKPLTHLLNGTTAQIEVYLSVVGQTTPFLHTTAVNDPSGLTQSITVTPDATTIGTEQIYTLGGALSNASAPPSRTVGYWRDRVLLGSGITLWASQELSEGFGPQYNEVLVTMWRDGAGEIIGQSPIDFDSYALFKTDRIAVIQGDGPDGRGAGNYVIRQARAQKGLINPRSVVTGPNGAYFQALADGRVYCVTPAVEITDVSSGMEDYRTETVSAVLWHEAERAMRFYTDGRILVLDYAHPTDTQPNGRWYSWDTAGILQAFGAALDDAGESWHIEAAGTMRTPGDTWQDATSGTAEEVYMDMTTGDLAAAGQLRGAYRLSEVAIEGQALGYASLRIHVTSNGHETYHNATLSGTPAEWAARVAGHTRVSNTRVRIREVAGSNTEALILDAISLTIQPLSKAKPVSPGQRLRSQGG